MPKGKPKGNAYERTICGLLSSWWTQGTNEGIFWRTANSGGRSTVRGKKGTIDRFHHGDICAIDPVGQPLLDLLTIEVKKGYNSHTIAHLLDKPDTAKEQQYEEWVRKAIEIKDRLGLFSWIIIARRDRREPILYMGKELWDEIVNVLWEGTGIHLHLRYKVADKYQDVYGIPFQMFLDYITPKTVKEILAYWKASHA